MDIDEIARSFAGVLADVTPFTDFEVQWPEMRLRVRTYLDALDLPAPLVSSARAVAFKGAKVVVVRNLDGVRHIEPGGRIEPGETIEATVRRELAEETGWTVGPLKRLGFHHFQPLGPRPAARAFRWGDFVHPLFVAEAASYDRRARDMTQIEVGSRLTPIRRALAELREDQASLLRAAVARRAQP